MFRTALACSVHQMDGNWEPSHTLQLATPALRWCDLVRRCTTADGTDELVLLNRLQLGNKTSEQNTRFQVSSQFPESAEFQPENEIKWTNFRGTLSAMIYLCIPFNR